VSDRVFKIVCEDCGNLSIKVADPAILLMPLSCGAGDATPSAGRWTNWRGTAMMSLHSNRQVAAMIIRPHLGAA
jgi:ribosomal protein S27E